MVVCHQAVARCLLAYFMDKDQGENTLLNSKANSSLVIYLSIIQRE